MSQPQHTSAGRRLSREGDPALAAAPIRMVHLGVGNFFRAHQAWYTQQSNDAATGSDQVTGERWGIAAFTGRSAAIADDLAPQDGLYTLVVKRPDGDHPETIGSLTAVHPADDLGAWRGYFADAKVAVVTSTITEAGYCRDSSGRRLDTARADVAADIAALNADPLHGEATTGPGKFVAGLLTRRDALGDAPITFVPCDNIPGNGAIVQTVVADLAAAVDPSLADWLAANTSYVTTMVDRITPRATVDDRARLLAETGVDDPAIVVTEPFIEWVLQGEFVGGRPRWEAGGARFVDDIEPFEHRKLWLLNGSHTLMAYAGTMVGHTTVAEAIADERVRGWVEQWWDLAAAHLPLPAAEISDYRRALIERYENANIQHLLAQIAADGSQKVPIRVVPALRDQLAAGGDTTGATRVIAAWIQHLRGLGAPVKDANESDVVALVSGSLEESVGRVLTYLGLDDTGEASDRLAAEVLSLARELEEAAAR